MSGLTQQQKRDWVTTDAILTTEQLIEKHGGNWGKHPLVPVHEWQQEVSNGDTRRGYWEHVAARLEYLADNLDEIDERAIYEGRDDDEDEDENET